MSDPLSIAIHIPSSSGPRACRDPYRDGVRWEALFADMEAQLDAARAADLQVQVAELTRAERATVVLVDRVRASRGRTVRVLLAAAEVVEGVLVDSADEWLLLAPGGDRRVLVPVLAVAGVAGLDGRSAPAAGAVDRRLGLGHALRALSRDRATVRVSSRGSELVGRIERVGADHLELGPGRSHAGQPAWVVPFASLGTVRSG